jgi:hypothetical protein
MTWTAFDATSARRLWPFGVFSIYLPLSIARKELTSWANGNTGSDHYFQRWAYSPGASPMPCSRPEPSAHMTSLYAPPSPERLQAWQLC